MLIQAWHAGQDEYAAMSSLWDNAFEKQKSSKLDGTFQVCGRCNLPYPRTASECEHCAHLDDDELDLLRQQFNQQHSEKKLQRRLAIIWTVVLLAILLIIFVIVM